MKLNRTYYVWIDPASGHIWNDQGFEEKKNAEAWYDDPGWIRPEPKLKLKKIKIVEVKQKEKV